MYGPEAAVVPVTSNATVEVKSTAPVQVELPGPYTLKVMLPVATGSPDGGVRVELSEIGVPRTASGVAIVVMVEGRTPTRSRYPK